MNIFRESKQYTQNTYVGDRAFTKGKLKEEWGRRNKGESRTWALKRSKDKTYSCVMRCEAHELLPNSHPRLSLRVLMLYTLNHINRGVVGWRRAKKGKGPLATDRFLPWLSWNPQKYKWVQRLKGNQKERTWGSGDVGPPEATGRRHREYDARACHWCESRSLYFYKIIPTAQGGSQVRAVETGRVPR